MSNYLKRFIKLILDYYNYKIIRKFYHDFGSDESIKKILNLRKNNTHENNFDDLIIFDVGANIGQSVNRFRSYSKACKIFSFEPSQDVYNLLKKKETNDQNLKTFNFGLGEKIEGRKFYEQPDSGASSFLKSELGEVYKLSQTKLAKKNQNITTLKKNIKFNNEISANLVSINSILDKVDVDHIDILKIDTQGFEENVLKGASDILDNTLIVEAEIMFGKSYIDQSSLDGIFGYLKKFGFIIWDIPYIGKFATNKMNRINFVDIIFVNKKLLDGD